MSPAAALTQPLAGTRGCVRQQTRRSQRAVKVLASGESREQSNAAGLAPKLLGVLAAGAVLLGGSGLSAEAARAPPALEQARAGAEDAGDAIQDKAGSAANAVKRGANKLKGGVEDAGDAIKSAASDVADAAGSSKGNQLILALTSSPDQRAGDNVRKSGLGRSTPSAGPSIPAPVPTPGQQSSPAVAPGAGNKAARANKEAAGSVVGAVKGKAGEAADAVKQGANKLKGGVEDAGDAIKSAVNDVASIQVGKPSSIYEVAAAIGADEPKTMPPVAPGAGEKAARANQEVKDKVVGAIKGKTDAAADAVKGGASQLKGGAEDAGDMIKDGARTLQGKASNLGDVAAGIGADEPKTMPPVAPGAGEKAVRANQEVKDKVVGAIKGKAAAAGDAVKQGANKLKGGAEDAGDAIKSAATGAGDDARNLKNDAKDAVYKPADDAAGLKDAIKDKADSAADAVKQGASRLVGGAEDTGDAIKSAASDLGINTGDVKDSAKFAKNEAGNTLTSSPDQRAGDSIMSNKSPFARR